MNSHARAIMLGTTIPIWQLVFLFAMPETSTLIRASLAGLSAVVYYALVITAVSLPVWRRVPTELHRAIRSD